MNFRGVEKSDSEFIDISGEDFGVREQLREVFLQAGFANYYDESGFKLLPCPPGTFVDISDTRPRCIDCPAGKLTQVICIKLAYAYKYQIPRTDLKCESCVLNA